MFIYISFIFSVTELFREDVGVFFMDLRDKDSGLDLMLAWKRWYHLGNNLLLDGSCYIGG